MITLPLDTIRPLIAAARHWIADCEWREPQEYLDELSDADVLAGVERQYDGGVEAFIEDGF